jgi:hypothetical protein
MKMDDAERIGLPDGSNLIKDSDCVDDDHRFRTRRTKVPYETGQSISDPASFCVLIQILSELLHGTTLRFDLLAKFLPRQALDDFLGFEDMKGKLLFEASGQ